MASKLVGVSIPEDLMPFLYLIKDGKTVDDKAILSIVMGLFLSKSITLEKAAELAGKNVWDFIELLKSQNLPWGEYTEKDLQMDDLAMGKITEGYYEQYPRGM